MAGWFFRCSALPAAATALDMYTSPTIRHSWRQLWACRTADSSSHYTLYAWHGTTPFYFFLFSSLIRTDTGGRSGGNGVFRHLFAWLPAAMAHVISPRRYSSCHLLLIWLVDTACERRNSVTFLCLPAERTLALGQRGRRDETFMASYHRQTPSARALQALGDVRTAARAHHLLRSTMRSTRRCALLPPRTPPGGKPLLALLQALPTKRLLPLALNV